MNLSERKRLSIITAAQEEFIAVGYNKAKMSVIADNADVSKRTLYKNFDSKEDLFVTIIELLIAESKQVTTLEYSTTRPLKDQLEELLRRRVNMLTNPHFTGFFKITLPEALHSSERADMLFQRLSKGPTFHWIEAAQRDGKLKDIDPEFMAYQVSGLVESFCFWPQIVFNRPVPTNEEIDNIVDSAVSIFINTYALEN